MSDTPSLVLTGSPHRWGWTAVGCGVLAFLGAMVALSGHYQVIGWLVAVAFLWLMVVAIRQMRRTDLLVLHDEAFEVVLRGATTTRDFASCSEFSVWREGSNKLVVFDHPTDDASPNAEANRAIAGRTGSLPHGFGMRPEHLAQLMNTARTRALGLDEVDGEDGDADDGGLESKSN